MKKLFTLAVLAALVSFTATAQNQVLHMNTMADNWQVSAGAGLNAIADNGILTANGFALEAEVAHFFTPGFGLGLGWTGLNNRATDRLAIDWFAGENSFSFNQVYADLMWDITNTFGYKPNRRFSAQAFARGGAVFTSYNGNTSTELLIGAGLKAAVRIAGPVSAYAAVAAMIGRESAWRTYGDKIIFPTATVGVQYAFGKSRSWNKHEDTLVETVKTVTVKDTAAAKRAAALEAELNRLQNAQPQVVEVNTATSHVVYFDLDKDIISDRELAHLEYFLSQIEENKAYTLTIVGHADRETGNPRHNMGLSERRAVKVSSAIASLGDFSDRNISWKGDTSNPFDTAPKNRCCIITVEYK